MGAYKSLHYRYTTQGWRPAKGEAELLGIALPLGGPLPPREEREAARAELSEAATEARAEREAIQAVEREAEAEIRRAADAARPKVFAPPPPDFPRTGRTVRADPPEAAAVPAPIAVAPEPAPEFPAELIGLACKLPWAADAHKAQARDLARFLATGGDPEMRGRHGEPEPPPRDTGWYRWGDAFCRVGSGPFPEYRPPGLTWKLRWTDPKPDDVPWEDEVGADATPPAEPPPAVAAEPEPPRAKKGGKLSQGSLFA